MTLVKGRRSLTEIALDSLEDVFIVARIPDGTLAKWNRALVIESGYSDAELTGMTVYDFLQEGELDRKPGLLSGLRESGHGTIEAEFLTREGKRIPYEFQMTIVREGDPGARPVLVGIGRDLSERLGHQEALRESEERFRTIADLSFTGIALHDGTNLVYMNDRFVEITGYPREHFTGAGEIFEILLPEYRDGFANAMWDLLRGKPIEVPPTVKLICQDGSICEVIASVELVRVGGSPAVLVAAFDLTDRRRLEAELLKQAQELSRMVSVAAHELRHPATIFKGYAGLLRTALEKDDGGLAAQALQSIDEAAERLGELVDKLLYASEAERGGIRLSLEEIDPGAMVNTAVEDVHSRIGGRFEVTLPDAVRTFPGDPERLGRVLQELLDNAVKFSEGSGPVDVIVEQDANQTVFRVRDRGSGIPEGDRDQVFDRFYQVGDVLHHSKPGIGLGLHFARAIVDAHGGWIEAAPRKGGGLEVGFGIPAGVGHDEGAHRALRVLAVDDDPDMVQLIKTQLRCRGHNPVGVYGGAEALEFVRGEIPDVIILDLMMPEVNGFHVLEALKSGEKTRDIPVVIVTAKTGEEVRRQVMALGAAAMLEKPYAMDDLLKAVEAGSRKPGAATGP
ncbi:MAG: PAS domain S-box protein [Actinobacteria bacterium]|nr:PAS domain S-box protein [Actinomycetota bacterium]MBU1943752.1 PAS domain S-box protein [Actinomycetota bacterium]MBU2688776.1 PAS domain S-box protein [Actinomycetota bacterium]